MIRAHMFVDWWRLTCSTCASILLMGTRPSPSDCRRPCRSTPTTSAASFSLPTTASPLTPALPRSSPTFASAQQNIISPLLSCRYSFQTYPCHIKKITCILKSTTRTLDQSIGQFLLYPGSEYSRGARGQRAQMARGAPQAHGRGGGGPRGGQP